jgi:hypothetical protein
MHFSTTIFAIAPLMSFTVAICPGFNFGIGNVQNVGKIGDKQGHHWNVYDDHCNVVDGLTTTENPCTSRTGIFQCSPNPVLFVGYKNGKTGLQYKCRQDGRSGKCGNDVISVCVSIMQCIFRS